MTLERSTQHDTRRTPTGRDTAEAGALAALGPSLHAESRGPHLKMALLEAALDLPGVSAVERMTLADVLEFIMFRPELKHNKITDDEVKN